MKIDIDIKSKPIKLRNISKLLQIENSVYSLSLFILHHVNDVGHTFARCLVVS